MVQEWVAREDLQDFFTVIKDDEEVDSRRLDYWMRFIKQIQFAKIYLGDDYFYSSNPILRRLGVNAAKIGWVDLLVRFTMAKITPFL